jgi:hypothetical protein
MPPTYVEWLTIYLSTSTEAAYFSFFLQNDEGIFICQTQAMGESKARWAGSQNNISIRLHENPLSTLTSRRSF